MLFDFTLSHFFFGVENHKMTSPAPGGAEGGAKFLLKTHSIPSIAFCVP